MPSWVEPELSAEQIEALRKLLPGATASTLPPQPMDDKDYRDEEYADFEHPSAKLCPVCRGNYKIMTYSHPGPCSGACKKTQDGDTEPWAAAHNRRPK